MALPANIILGLKSLPGTNTLAYYEHTQSTAVLLDWHHVVLQFLQFFAKILTSISRGAYTVKPYLRS